jgi:hypothetical protein
MDVFKSETREIIRRFLARQLGFPRCIAMLDSALADVRPRLTSEQLPVLRALVLTNNETVMKEMERRTAERPTPNR